MRVELLLILLTFGRGEEQRITEGLVTGDTTWTIVTVPTCEG